MMDRPPDAERRPPASVAERWVLGLKKQSQLDSQQTRDGSRNRPPPSASSYNSNNYRNSSSSTGMLETERNGSTIATSRASSHYNNTPQYRQSNPTPNSNRTPNSRSHSSLPINSNGSAPPSSSRHRDQQERVYSEPKYDAEFDRGSSSNRAGNSNGTKGLLFNPDSKGKLSANLNDQSRRREREDQKRVRSKREIIEPIELGTAKGSASKESLESEESDRPGSRSSKEGRHRRRKEGERESKPKKEGELGVGEGLNPTLVSEPSLSPGTASHSNSSRQLFDPRRDDPVRFAHGGPAIKKSLAPSIVSSFASSAISVASVASVESRNDRNDLTEEAVGKQDQNDFVTGLRKAYREITDLETKLQEEHKAAFVAATREEEAAQGLRVPGIGKKYDDEYWVKLATGHKQLADAHYSFLQMALDPRLPPSLHSLAQKYNIPTRLWQTAFHQLLERMRHAITSPTSPSSTSPTGATDSVNVLEHLIEFIQYAYGHYSQLFEDPSVAVFRSAWIEQLGDLARYRMAVAGLASRVSAQQSIKSNSDFLLTEVSYEKVIRGIDAASIGDAALGDWEVEEQEGWKIMARDWYSQGVTETPGSGRLQHHLALLSKGDELRGLYHYSKSLCASHPYLSARESILPLFEDELQARRTQPDVTKAELFVHLHGMLFTKIALDDFEECLERFLERLTEEACLMKRQKEIGELETFGDKEWFMIAVINIAAILQYGSDDGVLKKHVTKESESNKSESRAESNGASLNKGRTPQAIMMKKSEDSRETEANVKPLSETREEDPLVFRLAQRLSFSILDILLQNPFRNVGRTEILNPYIVLLFTFLSHMAQNPAGLRHLERSIPWYRLVEFLNTIPSSFEIKMEVSNKLLGNPLPEDWCIRGMEWTGRSLFSRSYWKPKLSGSKREENFMPPILPNSRILESEMEALRLELDTIDENHSGLNGLESPSMELANGRWKRIAINSAWLARNVPGLDFDSLAIGNSPKFSILGHLETKLRRWKKEESDAIEVERVWKVSQWSRDVEEIEIDESEDEQEDEEDFNDSPVIRELKARRKQLKAVIKHAAIATRSSPVKRTIGKSKRFNSRQSAFKIFAGYTVLVFDTNILLTAIKLFKKLIELETWTIVVPLAVITELDGLRKNSSPLGIAAESAINYLELTILTKSRHLKVQTSRGNYLKDLSIRSENIDFAGELETTTFSSDFAKNMDDIILKAVSWQKDHFTSRLAIVNPRADRNSIPPEAAKVVLISFDANLRVKAASRGLDATDEKGLKKLLDG